MDISAEVAQGQEWRSLVDVLECLTYNATRGESYVDVASLLGQGEHLAELLGYSPDSSPVSFYGRQDVPVEYVPGKRPYSPQEHIAGLTATIAQAPDVRRFGTDEKTRLIQSMVWTAEPKYSFFDSSALEAKAPSGPMSRHSVRHTALEAINGLRRNTVYHRDTTRHTELGEINDRLQEGWHPIRSKVTFAVLGSWAASRFAVGHKQPQ